MNDAGPLGAARQPARLAVAELGTVPLAGQDGPAAVSRGAGRRPGGPGQVIRASRRWPLLAVLAGQAGLSLRLIWSNTAFQDEALYLRAGHLEWALWLHHAPIPDFPAYFSGAPVLAAALFATLAGTQFLGAFATFDAMALFLLALAVWLGVRAADGQARTRIALLLACGCALAAADAVKYATALFTPVVLVVVALAVRGRHPGGVWLTGILAALGSWLVLMAAAVAAGGHQYWLGLETSTLARAGSDVPMSAVLQHAYVWTSLILVLAVLGVLLARRSETGGRLLPAVLAVAALLAPAEQARLHTTVSLQKHVVIGAWFAAIAAGYAMARLSRVDPGRGWAAVLALPIAASTLFGSMGQAVSLYRVWPDSTSLVSVLRSAVRAHPGDYLAEDYDVEAYYLRAQVPWQQWSDTYFFSYPGALPGGPSYQAAIDHHFFALVILDFGDTAATDRQIGSDMHHAGGYYILARTGPYTIWAARNLTGGDRGPR